MEGVILEVHPSGDDFLYEVYFLPGVQLKLYETEIKRSVLHRPRPAWVGIVAIGSTLLMLLTAATSIWLFSTGALRWFGPVW
jgi:hypothetical protein